ncbi:hypothetical protein MNBD_GAMMA22-309 [hydrothermal vent metagenome]|uniref:Rhodanese domain-containing protein n=1 Tax=hydrothermal vent metagenome TaxID=652676 RepID=A0A3B0ZSR6_9ZZZZ
MCVNHLKCLSPVILIFITFFVFSATSYTAVEFPGRQRYPAVPFITMTDLYKSFNNVVIVDVRSKYEFDTLRIKGAINIPLSSKDFVEKIRELRATQNKKIVLYCNGKTCMKSYKATQKCRVNKIKNVIAYDQGVLDWAKRYPAKSILLGKTPINPKHIISKKEFKTHLIKPEVFEVKINSKVAIVLDVRDPFQREALGLFIGIEKRANLDDYTDLDLYISKAKRSKLPIYIYDETGKQVRWLMYYLQQKKVNEYYFMEGGARAFFDGLRKKYVR